jgi:hypothetical protein
MRGTIPPLPNTPSWRGVHFKNSTGTNLPLPFTDRVLTDILNLVSHCDISGMSTHDVQTASLLHKGYSVGPAYNSMEIFTQFYVSQNLN